MRVIEPYFYFWAAALLYFGWVSYQALGVLRSIEHWLRAIAQDIARSRQLP